MAAEWTTTAYTANVYMHSQYAILLTYVVLVLQTNQRLFCISDILQSGKATKYIRDVQCQQLAAVFHKEGFYSP